MKTIWTPGLENEKNYTLGFSLKLPQKSDLQLKIAVSNTCRVYVNDNFIWYGPQRAAHGFAAVQDLALDKYLKDGDNYLTVEVACYNVKNFYSLKEQPFFSAQLISDGAVIAESDDFKAFLLNDRLSKVQRYSYQRTFVEVYNKYSRSSLYNGVSVYPQVDIVEVPSKTFFAATPPKCDFDKFLNGEIIETGDVAYRKDENPLRKQTLQKWSNSENNYLRDECDVNLSDELLAFEYSSDAQVSSDICISENRYALLDFGRNSSGFPSFEIEVIEPSEIYFMFDEIFWDEVYDLPDFKGVLKPENAKPLVFCRFMDVCNAMKWTLEPGTYNLMSFEPYTLQYGKIVVSKGKILLNNSAVRLFETASVKNMKFNSDDEDLNKIFEAAGDTLAQNSVDILMDCPSRERAGWLCDSYFSGKAEKLLTGDNVAEKNLLMTYCMYEELPLIPKQMLPMCYPADSINGTYIPNWAMWYVIELEDYLIRNNDKTFIEKSKQKVYNLVEFFKKYENEFGLLENLESWVFVEWSKANDFVSQVNTPSNILYTGMLKTVSRLYNDNELSEKADKLKEIIIEKSFNGEYFCDQLVREEGKLICTENYTETCQYYAFFFDVADKENFEALYNTLFKKLDLKGGVSGTKLHPSNAFIGKYLCMLYLLRQGKAPSVLETIKDYLLPMANRTGTFWEHDQTKASCCHGFAAVAANIILGATVGFLYIDEYNHQIVLSDNFSDKGIYQAKIPFEDGVLEINCRDGVREFKLPSDCNYTVVSQNVE